MQSKTKLNQKAPDSLLEQRRKEIAKMANDTIDLSFIPKQESIEFSEPINKSLSFLDTLKDLDIIENPDKAHRLYYQHIMRLLRDGLPAGKKYYENVRKPIYEQKNLYLKRGKMFGADSRQAHKAHLQEIATIVRDWFQSKGTPADIYNRLRQLNIDKGYITGDAS